MASNFQMLVQQLINLKHSMRNSRKNAPTKYFVKRGEYDRKLKGIFNNASLGSLINSFEELNFVFSMFPTHALNLMLEKKRLIQTTGQLCCVKKAYPLLSKDMLIKLAKNIILRDELKAYGFIMQYPFLMHTLMSRQENIRLINNPKILLYLINIDPSIGPTLLRNENLRKNIHDLELLSSIITISPESGYQLFNEKHIRELVVSYEELKSLISLNPTIALPIFQHETLRALCQTTEQRFEIFCLLDESSLQYVFRKFYSIYDIEGNVLEQFISAQSKINTPRSIEVLDFIKSYSKKFKQKNVGGPCAFFSLYRPINVAALSRYGKLGDKFNSNKPLNHTVKPKTIPHCIAVPEGYIRSRLFISWTETEENEQINLPRLIYKPKK